MSLLALSLSVGMVCVSCGGDEDEPSANTSSLSNSALSGKVESFDGSASTVKAMVYSYTTSSTIQSSVGEGAISSGGNFSMTLATPDNSYLGKIEADSSFAGTISDPTALVSQNELEIGAYSGNSLVGVLLKANFSGSVDDISTEGAAYSMFIYSNKEVTVSGKSSFSETYSGYQMSYVENCNFTLKKGWNELVFKLSKFSYTNTSITEEVTLTNTISSDLKWRLVSGTLKSAVVDNSPKAHFPKTPLIFKSK